MTLDAELGRLAANRYSVLILDNEGTAAPGTSDFHAPQEGRAYFGSGLTLPWGTRTVYYLLQYMAF